MKFYCFKYKVQLRLFWSISKYALGILNTVLLKRYKFLWGFLVDPKNTKDGISVHLILASTRNLVCLFVENLIEKFFYFQCRRWGIIRVVAWMGKQNIWISLMLLLLVRTNVQKHIYFLLLNHLDNEGSNPNIFG